MKTAESAEAVYRQSEFGRLPLLLITLLVGWLIFLSFRGEESPVVVTFVLAYVVALCFLLFLKMTVEITPQTFRLRFGVIEVRRFSTDTIRSFGVEQVPFWAGWGYRVSRRGILYRVGGNQAVRIDLRSGESFFVGTRHVEALCAALAAHVGADLQEKRAEASGAPA